MSQGLGIYIGRGVHCVAARRPDGRAHLLIDAMNEEMLPNVVARSSQAWLLGGEAVGLRRRQPQDVEVDPLGRLLAGLPIELAGTRLEAVQWLELVLGQAAQIAQQRLAASPQTLAVALSPEVWPVLGEALAPAARAAQLNLTGAWPSALAEAAALWAEGAPATPAHYLHLHAGEGALHADLVRFDGQGLGLLATARVPGAGVEALREALVQWALQRVRQDMGLEGQSQPRFLAALRNTAQVALGDLERFGSGCLVVMGGLRGQEGEILDLELDLDLNDYRQLARPRLEEVAGEVGRLLRGAGLGWTDLHQVGLRLGGLEANLLRQLFEDGWAPGPTFLPSSLPGQASALAAAGLALGSPWPISLAPAPATAGAGQEAPVPPPPPPAEAEASVFCPPEALGEPAASQPGYASSAGRSGGGGPSQSGYPAAEDPAPVAQDSTLELLGEGTDMLPAGASSLSGEAGPAYPSEPSPAPPAGAGEDLTAPLAFGPAEETGPAPPAGAGEDLTAPLVSGPAEETGPAHPSEPSPAPPAGAGEDLTAPLVSGPAEETGPAHPSEPSTAPQPPWSPREPGEPEPSPPLDLRPQETPAPAHDPGRSSWQAPPSPPRQASDQPQTVAQRYLILETKARESYATLYRARDTQSGGTVLLKLFATNKEPAKQAFARALTVRHIRHPNLDPILDLGPHGRGMFITFADEGRVTVREVISRGKPGAPLPLSLALRVMQGLGEALRAIHLIQLSHRNVKPEKVWLRQRGPGLWLGGFELCQFTPPGLRVQAAAGTPNYMAPEVWRGEPCCASDIFAASVFLYEMVTGRLPFWGRDPRQLEEAIRLRRPLPPGEHNRTLPPEMDQLILRGLAKDPQARVLDWAALRAQGRACDHGPEA